MSQGNYDHPSYITRQMLNLGNTTAGAGGTSARRQFPWPIRVRSIVAGVVTAGTVVGTGVGAAGACVSLLNNGTAIGTSTVVLSTNAAGVFGTAGDMNFTLAAGNTLSVVNGTDATLVANVGVEWHIDPSATWLGNG